MSTRKPVSRYPRLKKLLVPVLVLAAVQAALVALYLVHERNAAEPVPVQRLRPPAPAPELLYRSHDGAQHRLSELRGRPVLVHFWATWCPPCIEELPGLLELAASGEVAVLAISVDSEWAPVEQFLASVAGSRVPPAVVLADSDAVTQAFGVQALPETYLMDAEGRLRLRFTGARDWSSGAVRRLVLATSSGRDI